VEQEFATNLLHCVHSTLPPRDIFGPYKVDTVYEAGHDGKDWVAVREIDQGNGRIDYQVHLDGKTYVDVLGLSKEGNPGEDTVIDDTSAKPGPIPNLEPGSPEYNKVVDFVHNIYNTGVCRDQLPKHDTR
jgi:hypothetical protein